VRSVGKITSALLGLEIKAIQTKAVDLFMLFINFVGLNH